MRGFRGSETFFRRPAGSPVAVLFPELAGDRRTRLVLLAEGLLRAAPRGRAAPPCLSALALAGDIASPEKILAERGWEDPVLLARAVAGRRSLVAARVGGEWWHSNGAGELPAGDGLAIVALAAAQDATSTAMLDAALAEYPAERVVILLPGAGRVRHPGIAAAASRGATVVRRPLDPWHGLDHAARVYCAGGEIGLLALVCGIRVAAFGGAFYTGWGVTEDAAGVPQRAFRRTLDEIFAGGCLVATRYRDPFRNALSTFEDTLALLADWRRLDAANRGIAVCVGMSFWKRRRIADFVRSSGGVPVFRRRAGAALAAARRDGAAPRAIAGWASRLPDGLAA